MTGPYIHGLLPTTSSTPPQHHPPLDAHSTHPQTHHHPYIHYPLIFPRHILELCTPTFTGSSARYICLSIIPLPTQAIRNPPYLSLTHPYTEAFFTHLYTTPIYNFLRSLTTLTFLRFHPLSPLRAPHRTDLGPLPTPGYILVLGRLTTTHLGPLLCHRPSLTANLSTSFIFV